MISPIRNLVLEGGGVLGAAEVGAVLELRAAGILEHAHRFAGTSAGSIIATILALGATDKRLEELVRTCPYRSFTDLWPPPISYRILRHYGLYRGDAFLRWLQSVIEELTGNPDLPFGELRQDRELLVVAYNVSKGARAIFSRALTPKVKVADGVRASMSIPMFFRAHRIDGDVYVDGGTVQNFAIRIFDRPGEPDPHTLGIRVDAAAERRECRYDKPARGLLQVLGRIATAMHAAGNGAHLEPQDWQRTVWCDSLGIPATKFGLTSAEVDRLVESGRKGAREWVAWKRGQAA